MTDTPNFTDRPPHISPRRWYAAPWSARKAAIDEWNRANRPPDNDRPTHAPSTPEVEQAIEAAQVSLAERVAAIELCLDAGWTAEQIVAELALKPATIVRYLEREGRHDLKRGFNRIVSSQRRAA